MPCIRCSVASASLLDVAGPGAPFAIFLLSLESGEKRRVTLPPNGYVGDLSPHFSSDGRTLAFIRARYETSNTLYLLPISGDGKPEGEPRRLTSDQPRIAGLDWTSDGRSIVYSLGQPIRTNLWMISASGGTPERLAGGENATDISISRVDNRLVYSRNSTDSNIWRIPGPKSSDRKSAAKRLIASTQPDQEPQFSADGRKIVFTSSRSGTYSIWICDRDGLNPMELVSFGEITVGSPRWSPDSQWIAFDSPKAGNWNVYIIRAEGQGLLEHRRGHHTRKP